MTDAPKRYRGVRPQRVNDKELTTPGMRDRIEEGEPDYEATLPPPGIVQAPFTPEQMDALNAYQSRGDFHPYTCGSATCRTALVATEGAWRCPECSYVQGWAYEGSVRLGRQ